MSQEDDIELAELVTEALEKDGVLAKIRAQLRANIFMTLENEHGQKHQNSTLKDIFNSREGVLALLLVQELLEFCSLIQTAFVFKAETSQGKAYKYEGRQHLSKVFNVTDSKSNDSPVLVKLVDVLCKSNGRKSSGISTGSIHIDTSHDRSDASEISPRAAAHNNTFLINSGRSDNYDLSFASDTGSSISTEEKNKIVLPLNLNNSSESTDNESLSTEIGGNNLHSAKSSESSIKQVESLQDQSESARIVSEILLNSTSKDSNSSSIKTSIPEESPNKKQNTSPSKNSYSKYLKEKHETKKKNNEVESIIKQSENIQPIDNVMKHFINSRINRSDSTSDESLSEEIIQAFENSEKSPNGDKSFRSESIGSNPLDETLPESPRTKQRIRDQINSLKQQSLKIQEKMDSVISDKNINAKNEKNKLLKDYNQDGLVIEKSVNVNLPPYKNHSDKPRNKNILVDGGTDKMDWKDS